MPRQPKLFNIHLNRLRHDKLYRVICDSLLETIRHHGPIDGKFTASAAKRISGQISSMIKNEMIRTAITMNKATPGDWIANCAGEIFATIDGEEVRIGHFQGCASDARAVCMAMRVLREYVTNTSQNCYNDKTEQKDQ